MGTNVFRKIPQLSQGIPSERKLTRQNSLALIVYIISCIKAALVQSKVYLNKDLYEHNEWSTKGEQPF